LALPEWIGTARDFAKEFLGLGARSFWRQRAMPAELGPPRTAVETILDVLGFFPGRERRDAKARQGGIPNEFPVLARRARQRVDSSLGNAFFWHGPGFR
jgi:hypothetical protein